ncbi:MAG TPA: hypothetical protein VHX38_30220 [Pseudonocardiaceae bacterium]|jgi:hypothetical protein|nr:hypothetical protein [Pseudonocardiaceae bacterium]
MIRLAIPSIRLRRTIVAAAAGTAAVAGLLVGVPSANASQDASILATYPVNGTTSIASTNSTMTLGPGTLAATLDVTTEAFTADLSLPAATGSFTEFGIVPVTATTEFIQDGPTTGSDVNGGIQSTSQITIKLADVKIAGIDVPVGDSCETSPATINLASETGFNVLTGGNIAGTYTIPDFSNCGLATPLINIVIPGPGNTIALTLGKPTISVPPSS